MTQPVFTSAESGRSALAAHMSQVFNYMAGGVALSGLVAYLVSQNQALATLAMKGNIVWMLVLLGVAFFLQRIVFSLQPAAGLAVFAGFSALFGFALAPMALIYTGSSISTAFVIAALMFGGVSAFGYTTKRDLSPFGTFLVMGVWGLVGASLVGLALSFFGINMGPMNTVINVIAVPLFAGLTAWEVNTIRQTYDQYGHDEPTRSRLAILQAVSLYINFINMFTSLLQLMGDRR